MNLHNKIKLYKKLIQPHQDENGFINTNSCDSLLFSGLLATAIKVDLWKAREKKQNGRWLRRPATQPECRKCGESKSSISRDMLLGLMIGAYSQGHHLVFYDIVQQAKRRFGFMGSGYPSRTFIGSLIGTAIAGWNQLAGWKYHPVLSKVPYKPSLKVIGFEAHLAVLHVYLRQQLGLIDADTAQQYYMHHAERQPLNPLFLALSGQYVAAEAILMDEGLWPNDRLPRSSDRKEPWLLQRDFGNDWLPASDADDDYDVRGIEHNGADFLFCATLLKKLRKDAPE